MDMLSPSDHSNANAPVAEDETKTGTGTKPPPFVPEIKRHIFLRSAASVTLPAATLIPVRESYTLGETEDDGTPVHLVCANMEKGVTVEILVDDKGKVISVNGEPPDQRFFPHAVRSVAPLAAANSTHYKSYVPGG